MFQKPFSFNSSSSSTTTTTTTNDSQSISSNKSNKSIKSTKSNKSNKSQNSTLNSIRSRQDSLIFERLVQDQLLDYQPNNNINNFSANKKIHTENYIPSSLDSTTIMINSPLSGPNDNNSNNNNNNNNNNITNSPLTSSNNEQLDNDTPFKFVRRPSMVNLESALTNGLNSKRNSISMINMKKSSSINSNSQQQPLQKTNSTVSLSYADMLNEEEKDLQSRLNLNNFRRPSITNTPSSSNGINLTRNNSNRSLRSHSIISNENLARSPILSRTPTNNNSNNISPNTTTSTTTSTTNNNNNNIYCRQSIPLTRSNSRLTNQLNKFQLGNPQDDDNESLPSSPLLNQSQFSPPRQQQQSVPPHQQPPQFVRTNSLAGLSRKLSVTAQSSPMLPNSSSSSSQLTSPISNLSNQFNNNNNNNNKSVNSLLLKKKKQLKNSCNLTDTDDIERSISNDSYISQDSETNEELSKNLQNVII